MITTIAEVIEQCAKAADVVGGKVPDDIRSLKAQYEGCIVAELPAAHGRSVGVPLYRAKEPTK